MQYKEFDRLMGRKTEENVINLLQERPYTTEELAELIKLDRTTIHYQLKKLETKGMVEAKGFSKIVYYGLKKKYRKSHKPEVRSRNSPQG